eukprot:TRINITY_DN9997_c0_g1_i1.p1 TRINITY_DN9997_c0_g1~~TRINITY_DN9997_c0_g1_i1.p1  ORF type:complete len:224 (-),score=78.57 TRINITY_DN9997_c0_g1_i1:169-813(-)
MGEVKREWDDLSKVTKKELVGFLQKNGSNDFLFKHRLKGKLNNVAKAAKKPALDKAYEELFATKAFRTAADEEELKKQKEQKEAEAKAAAQADTSTETKEEVIEEKLFKKITKKKGDKVNFPKKGDKVTVKYRGTLDDGTVFDSNMGKKGKPLTFKVGLGKVIRGWDEGLLEMSKGEVAKLVIESEWAYGAKGIPGTIPPNSTLTFEVELLSIG